MIKRFDIFVIVMAFLALFFVLPAAVYADDFDLPPPPDANEDLVPPPPGTSAMGDETLPPPPGGGDEMPPPPGDDTGALPPPPGDDSGSALPPPPDESASSDMPPPPAEEASSELPPPPGEEASSELPPPPGDDGMSAPPSIENETPPAEATEEPARVVKKPSAGTSKYTVKSGDSLWRISGKESTYGDSFKWPLLFKSNRALIEDPDLIYARQALKVSKKFSAEEEEDAVGKAKETPPYEPHSSPRKQLPIKY